MINYEEQKALEIVLDYIEKVYDKYGEVTKKSQMPHQKYVEKNTHATKKFRIK
jgi:hypothetical protein